MTIHFADITAVIQPGYFHNGIHFEDGQCFKKHILGFIFFLVSEHPKHRDMYDIVYVSRCGSHVRFICRSFYPCIDTFVENHSYSECLFLLEQMQAVDLIEFS